MSVLSCGPPFHTAAFTITSITSNYLAVFPLLALSPAFISALELYAFQMGATALPPPTTTPPRGGEEEEEEEDRFGEGREGEQAGLGKDKSSVSQVGDCKAWLG